MRSTRLPKQVRIAVLLFAVPLVSGVLVLLPFLLHYSRESFIQTPFVIVLIPAAINLLMVVGLLQRGRWAHVSGGYMFLVTALFAFLIHSVVLLLFGTLISDNYQIDEGEAGPWWWNAYGIVTLLYIIAQPVVYTLCTIAVFRLLKHQDVKAYYSDETLVSIPGKPSHPTDKPLVWHCTCGEVNIRSAERCRKCEKRQS